RFSPANPPKWGMPAGSGPAKLPRRGRGVRASRGRENEGGRADGEEPQGRRGGGGGGGGWPGGGRVGMGVRDTGARGGQRGTLGGHKVAGWTWEERGKHR